MIEWDGIRLGHEPDEDTAARLGCSVAAVTAARRARRIKKFVEPGRLRGDGVPTSSEKNKQAAERKRRRDLEVRRAVGDRCE